MDLGSLITSLGVDSTGLWDAENDMNKFQHSVQKSMDKVQSQLDKTGQKMRDIGKNMTLFVTTPILAAGGYAFKMASDLNESMNKVDVAFKSSAEGIKNWSEDTLKAFGISQGSALDMAATFGDMSTSMGLTTARSADMAKSLVGLVGDLASFKNIGIDQARTALVGIFSGETESLKKLGIVMNETNMAEYALSQGIKKKMDVMTQAEKVLLRYNYILSVTKNSQGDFVRTEEGAANQLRMFGESVKQVAAKFGALLLPAGTAALKWANEFFDKIMALDESTKKWIIGIAAVAAATGPMIWAIGGVIKVISLAATGVTALTTAMTFLKAATVSNPWGLIITLTTAAAGAVWMYSRATNAAVISQEKLNEDLTRYNSILNMQAGIQSSMKTVTGMKGPELEGLQADISAQLDLVKKATAAIDGEYDNRLKNDALYLMRKAAYEKAAAIDKNSSDAINASMQMDKSRKYFMDLRDLEKGQYAKSETALTAYLATVNAAMTTAAANAPNAKATEAITAAGNAMEILAAKSKLFDTALDGNTPKLEIYTNQLNGLMEAGIRTGIVVQDLANKINDLSMKPMAIKTVSAVSTPTNKSKMYADAMYQGKGLMSMQKYLDNAAVAQARLLEPTAWQTFGNVIMSVADSFQSLGNAMAQASADGAISFAEGANIIMQTAMTTIGVLSALAAAHIITAEASKGVIGIFAAVAGLAMLAGLWATFVTPKKNAVGMANGGIVPAGYPNDSYPAMLTSGETVTPPGNLSGVFGKKSKQEVIFKIQDRELVGILRNAGILRNSY